MVIQGSNIPRPVPPFPEPVPEAEEKQAAVEEEGGHEPEKKKKPEEKDLLCQESQVAALADTGAKVLARMTAQSESKLVEHAAKVQTKLAALDRTMTELGDRLNKMEGDVEKGASLDYFKEGAELKEGAF